MVNTAAYFDSSLPAQVCNLNTAGGQIMAGTYDKRLALLKIKNILKRATVCTHFTAQIGIFIAVTTAVSISHMEKESLY